MSITRASRTVALLIVLACSSFTISARAKCGVGDPTLLWSYPAEGDQDVPPNASFWVLTTWASSTRPKAWLNGAPLPVSSERERDVAGIDLHDVRIAPGRLRANTAYTLRVRYAWPDGTDGHDFEIHFRTGRARAKPPAPSEVIGRSQLSVADAHILPCQQLFGVQGCFDAHDPEHPPRVQSFELEDAAPIAWFVTTEQGGGSLLWPAQCGDPALWVDMSRGDECFALRAIGRGGLMAPAVQHCIGPRDAPTHASQRGFRDAGQALPTLAAAFGPPPQVPPVEPKSQPAPVEAKPPTPPPPSSGGCSP